MKLSVPIIIEKEELSKVYSFCSVSANLEEAKKEVLAKGSSFGQIKFKLIDNAETQAEERLKKLKVINNISFSSTQVQDWFNAEMGWIQTGAIEVSNLSLNSVGDLRLTVDLSVNTFGDLFGTKLSVGILAQLNGDKNPVKADNITEENVNLS